MPPIKVFSARNQLLNQQPIMQAGMLRLSFVLTLFCGLQDELRSSAALLLNADLLHPTAAAAELPCSFQEACTE